MNFSSKLQVSKKTSFTYLPEEYVSPGLCDLLNVMRKIDDTVTGFRKRGCKGMVSFPEDLEILSLKDQTGQILEKNFILLSAEFAGIKGFEGKNDAIDSAFKADSCVYFAGELAGIFSALTAAILEHGNGFEGIFMEKYSEFEKYFFNSVLETGRYLKSKAEENKALPLISIIIPAYKEEDYISAALESIRRQDYPNYEIVIGENSSRTTFNMARYFTHLYDYTEQKGVSRGRNNAVGISKGEILVFMDADVVLSPGTLSRIYRFFLKKNKKGVRYYSAGTCRINMDVHRADMNKFHLKRKMKAAVFNAYKSLNDFIFYLFDFHVAFTLFFSTRDVFHKVGGFNEEMIAGEDCEYLIKIGKTEKIGRIFSKCGIVSDRRMNKMGYLNIIKGWYSGGDENKKNYEKQLI